MKSRLRESIHVILLIGVTALAGFAQDTLTPVSNTPDSIRTGLEGLLTPDSSQIGVAGDSLLADSLTVDSNNLAKKEKPPFESEVVYSADDSIRMSVAKQIVYLYGNAHVAYESIALDADYIEIDLRKKEVKAFGSTDSTGQAIGKPVFKDNDTEYKIDTIRYNFDSKRGLISRVVTQDGDGFLHAERAKKDANDNLYVRNGRYTTCNHPTHPHFYIQASKLKVIKDKQIVTGPAFLSIQDVPTLLAVPFGLFPAKNERTSGVLIPSYGFSPTLGYYLQDGGYYQRISDHLDVALQGDIYTRGSWATSLASKYRVRYRFNGNLNVRYNTFLNGIPEEPSFNKSTNFFIQWRHNQDPKARPNSRFSANVNAGSSNTFRNDINTTANDFLTNTFQSSINYGKSWTGKPYNLTISASHSQNTRDSIINVTIPNAAFTVNRIFPFKAKVRVGKERFYEKIGFSYNSSLQNRVRAKEDVLFTNQTLEEMRNGFQHSVPVNTSIKLLKYFTLNPSFTGTQKVYRQRIEQTWNADSNEIEIDTITGLSSIEEWTFNAGLSTRFYGMFTFRKNSKIQAIRHVLTPSINFRYTPDQTDNDRYFGTVQNSETGDETTYNRFSNGIFGGASSSQAGLVSFSLMNNLEMKVRTPNDSVSSTKKIKIFESFNFNSAYNINADSLNWSALNISARTLLLEKINVQMNATVDPYDINENGTRINDFVWNSSGGPGRLTTARAAIGFRLKSSKSKKSKSAGNSNNFNGTADTPNANQGTQELLDIQNNPDAYVDFNVPWSLNVNYNITYSRPQFEATVNNSFTFTGDVNLTPRWKLGFNSGYDIRNAEFTYTRFNIYRDLHCWEFQFNMIPFGTQQSYTFDINVKSSVLQDLKLSRRRNWRDLSN